MVLETTFTSTSDTGGVAVLTDALAVGSGERGHDLGAESPGVLLRRLTCTAGTIEADVSYAPRPEYGLIEPVLIRDDGGVGTRGGAHRLRLSTSVPFTVNGATATARVRLAAGEAAVFAVGHGQLIEPPPPTWTSDEITDRLQDTVESWRSWS